MSITLRTLMVNLNMFLCTLDALISSDITHLMHICINYCTDWKQYVNHSDVTNMQKTLSSFSTKKSTVYLTLSLTGRSLRFLIT